MFKATWKLGNADIELAKEIRKSVFIEEMGMQPSEVFDNHDNYSAHLEIFEEETQQPIATARMYPDHVHGNDCDCCSLSVTHIGEIAVMKNYQNTNKYYDLALRMLLYKAESLSGKQIVADVFESELPIYESFGFEMVEKNANKIRVSVDKDKVLWHSECHGS
ncbi:MAG: GNAT family N-acetyltransferase [Clostridiales bacterium]|jgi:predicted GNAT family N-acyltransferase|nr:GNAT family N-acetyltransferase [Clostridiales bacterium]